MSLDVYLHGPKETVGCSCVECGHTHTRVYTPHVYWRNITHNLGKMAEAAEIYQHCWHPDELGIKTASELIAPLEKGLTLLKLEPDHFKQFNASNGWGLYEHLVEFVEDYLRACKENPTASVRVSR